MEKVRFEDGVHDISNSEYHGSQGISRSSLMKIKKSPYHYWYEYESGLYQRPEPTDALILGDVVHTIVLEPHLYDERYVISPKFDRRTTAGKADYAAFQESAMGKVVLSPEIAAQAAGMAGAVNQNEIACSLLADSVVEESIFWTHETGLQCKVRPDSRCGSVVVDLKTSKDAGFRGFQSSAFSFGYFVQAGMIHQGLKSIGVDMEKFVFIAVEKDLPYAVGIYVLDEEALDYGINQFNELMGMYAMCLDRNEWPGYGISALTLPGYAKFETMLEVE